MPAEWRIYTFVCRHDQHLIQLYRAGIVSGVQALSAASTPEAVALEIRMPGAVVSDATRRP